MQYDSRRANYEIIQETEAFILLRDLGPWDQYFTISNGAEIVVSEIAPRLAGRRLEYIGSDGIRTQLLVQEGQFAGFRTAPEG